MFWDIRRNNKFLSHKRKKKSKSKEGKIMVSQKKEIMVNLLIAA